MSHFKLSLKSGLRAGVSATALSLLVGVGAAAAQTAPQGASGTTNAPIATAPADEGIVVTGFRSSLNKALNLKRESEVSADTILAEDIGKFPDLNLSESIQRIPGVALARDAGEGREITVRGLGPQFTRVLINGLEALTTTGGSDAAGGTNRSRSFDFNVFASDLFNEITIAKTSQAATEEGSLGATVELRTARPFDYKGATLVMSGQGSYNDLAEQTSPRAAFLASDIFMDGKLGALVSIAYTKRQLDDIGVSTVRWATGNAFAPGFAASTAPGVSLAQADAAFHPRFPRFDNYADDQQRLGATLAFTWRPNPKGELNLDLLYADFKGTRQEQYLEAPSFSVGGACTAATTASGACGIAQTTVTAATIDTHNTMITGTFNNVDLRVEDRFDKLDTTFFQYGFSGNYHFTDKLWLDGRVGHNLSQHKNPIQTTLTLDQFNVQNYSYDFTSRVPLLSYGSANLTNPGSWVLTQIRERPQFANNSYDLDELNLHYDWNDNLKFEAGPNYKQYLFSTLELRRSNGTTTNQEAVIPAAIAGIPLSQFTTLAHLNTSGLGAPGGTVTSWIVPDLNAANTLLQIYNQNVFGGAFHLGPEPALGNDRSVKEEDSGGYVQANFNGVLPFMDGVPVHGNLGVRYVKTDQSAKGFSFLSGAPVAVTTSRNYTDTLPALNLVFDVSHDFLIRFGASKVMARPDLGSLTPGATVSVSGSSRSVTAGNPNLNPFRATSYDLSFEYYFARESLLSVAFFRKEINSFVQTLSSTGTFTGNAFGLPDSIAIAACGTVVGCSPSAQWNFSTPVNGPGGNLDGVEINYQQPFRFLPWLLRNTGVLLNYTTVQSRIQYLSATGAILATQELTGLSKNSYNATLYYEDARWSARVSAAYRSKYLTRVPGQEAGTDVDGTNSTFNVDANITYTWNRNFKFTVQGINLTDQFQDQFNDSSNRVSFYHHTGREFLFGVRYTY